MMLSKSIIHRLPSTSLARIENMPPLLYAPRSRIPAETTNEWGVALVFGAFAEVVSHVSSE